MIKDINTRLVTLLDANTTADDESPIIPRSDFRQHSVQVINPGGETVKILGSNSPVNEEGSIVFTQIATDITGDEIVVLDGTVRWLKVTRGAGVSPVTVHILSTSLGLD